MRNCNNCFDGHYNLSERGEELFCGDSFFEEKVDPTNTCESHRYIPGMEEDKNYVFYDESFLAPGYIIVNMSGEIVNKFFKIYTINQNGFPTFAISAFSKDFKENPEENFSSISFSFRDIEDNENGLYEIFTKLCLELNNEKLYSIDLVNHGKNHLEMSYEVAVTTLKLSRDNYYGDQFYNDYINIILGDDFTCKNYESFVRLFNELKERSIIKKENIDIKKLILK